MTLLVKPPPAPVVFYVTLQARNLQSLWNALEKIQKHRGYLGRAKLWLDCRYASYGRDGIVQGVTVKSRITIRMPQWGNREHASDSDRAEWERFYTALLEHEREHEQIMRRGLEPLHQALEKARATEFKTIMNREKRRLIDLPGAAYDERTDHGRKRGTILNVPAGP
jgi:predicted secreted Zn-dependent protease